MKKKCLLSYLALVIVFALFNTISFLLPCEKTATFWTEYAFSVLAFAVQIPIWNLAFDKKDTPKSKFLGISLIQVGLGYLILQLIAFAVFVIFPKLPFEAAVIASAVVLSVSVLFLIGGRAAADEINRVEERGKVKRFYIQTLQADIELIANSETDVETKAALKKLAEKLRYSDPMSHEMLGELESRISTKVEEMKAVAEKMAIISEIDTLLNERNKKCKILKN